MGLNTGKHRIYIDICTDTAQVIVWTPAGPVTCTSAKQTADLLHKIAKQQEPVEVSHRVPPKRLETETFEAWQARGGKITVVEPNVKSELSKEQVAAVTLDSLGL